MNTNTNTNMDILNELKKMTIEIYTSSELLGVIKALDLNLDLDLDIKREKNGNTSDCTVEDIYYANKVDKLTIPEDLDKIDDQVRKILDAIIDGKFKEAEQHVENYITISKL